MRIALLANLGSGRGNATAAERLLRGCGAEIRRFELDRGDRDDGERPFVNAASVGLSPVAAAKARGMKRLLGPLAYTVAALRAGATAKRASR